MLASGSAKEGEAAGGGASLHAMDMGRSSIVAVPLGMRIPASVERRRCVSFRKFENFCAPRPLTPSCWPPAAAAALALASAALAASSG